jgi:hypothetical protein
MSKTSNHTVTQIDKQSEVIIGGGAHASDGIMMSNQATNAQLGPSSLGGIKGETPGEVIEGIALVKNKEILENAGKIIIDEDD